MTENPENQVDEALLAEVRSLYTPLSVAKEEIKRRSQDEGLKKRVMDFLDGDLLPCLVDGPKAVLARAVASPNFETLYFLDLAETIGLPPVLVEFIEDKFVDKNFCKHHLGKIFIDHGRGKNGGHQVSGHSVIDFYTANGTKIKDINTIWGQSLVDFHHEMLRNFINNKEYAVYDFSTWFRNSIKKSGDYFYLNFLTLFVCHGVLFESFLLNNEEVDFTIKKVIPTIKKIEKIFGFKPIIVPMQPPKYEKDDFWYYYPLLSENFIKLRSKV